MRSERRCGLVRVIDTGPLFRRGSDVATVPGERVTHGCDDQSVGLTRPDDRPDGTPSNVGEAEIKRLHWTPAASDRVGVTAHVEIKLVVVFGNERQGETNINDLPVAVINLFGVGGLDLKHVARPVGAVRGQPGAVFCQTSQDAPQKNVPRSVGTVDEMNFVASDRDRDVGRERGAAGVCKGAQDDGAKPV